MNNIYICDSELNTSFGNIVMTMISNTGCRFTNINVSRSNINYNMPFIYIVSNRIEVNKAIEDIEHYISKNKIIYFKNLLFVTNIIGDDFTLLKGNIKSHFGIKAKVYNSIKLDTSLADLIIKDSMKIL